MVDDIDEPPKSVDDEATSHAEPSKADGGNDTNNGDSTAAATDVHDESTSPDKKRPIEDRSEGAAADDEPMPTLPLKKTRTAYFIFADEKREKLKEQVRTITPMLL
jgi:hypothetical protein